MKWIRLKDRNPDVKIDGDRILLYRITNKSQSNMSISICRTNMIKVCNKERTWWMSLPEKPII